MGSGNYTTRLDHRFLQAVAPDGATSRFRLLLFDFDTGRSELGSRHFEALNRYVVSRLGPNQPRCEVWIGGIASRRGDARFNHGLAWARAAGVESYLRSQVPGLGNLTSQHSLRATWHGERHSVGQSENSEYYRSVLVVITQARPYRPPARPPARPQLRQTNRFKIRFDWGGEGEVGLSAGIHTYVIDYDQIPNAPPPDPVWYRLVGVGFGVGVSVGVGNPMAPWNSFTSQRVTTTRDFRGSARVTSTSASASYRGIGGGVGHTFSSLFAQGSGENRSESIHSSSPTRPPLAAVPA